MGEWEGRKGFHGGGAKGVLNTTGRYAIPGRRHSMNKVSEAAESRTVSNSAKYEVSCGP